MGVVVITPIKAKIYILKEKREKKKANREAAWLKKQGGTE